MLIVLYIFDRINVLFVLYIFDRIHVLFVLYQYVFDIINVLVQQRPSKRFSFCFYSSGCVACLFFCRFEQSNGYSNLEDIFRFVSFLYLLYLFMYKYIFYFFVYLFNIFMIYVIYVIYVTYFYCYTCFIDLFVYLQILFFISLCIYFLGSRALEL